MKKTLQISSLLLGVVLFVLAIMLFRTAGTPRIGAPLPGLTDSELVRFEQGKQVFTRTFSPEEGLGPLFNSTGCVVCHSQPVTGGSSSVNELHATRLLPSNECDPLFNEGGPVIQQKATPLLEAHGITKEDLPPSATSHGERRSLATFGLGLVDAIPEETILANADPDDANSDGISGRANRFLDGRLGRFGHKAFIPALFDFNAGAFPIEQGLTTPLSPQEETINGRPVPPDTDPTPEPEVGLDDIEKVTDFLRFLAAPAQHRVKGVRAKLQVRRGRKLFDELRCSSCHVPELQTGPSNVAALDRKKVAIYSDLLLHDMGPDLADLCLGLATPDEFRTALLMGLRFREAFMHDGRAGSIRGAIELHAGEAAPSHSAFVALPEKDKEALLLFLDTL